MTRKQRGAGPGWKAVYELNDAQFEQWKEGRRVTPVYGGGGCLIALLVLPFAAILSLLRGRRP